MIYPNPAKDVETTQYPYAELFRDFAASVCKPNSVVVTYGYGFGDDHVKPSIEGHAYNSFDSSCHHCMAPARLTD